MATAVKLQTIGDMFTAVGDTLASKLSAKKARNGRKSRLNATCSPMVIELPPHCRRLSPLLQWAFLGGEPGLQGGAATLPAPRNQGVAEPFGAGLTDGHSLFELGAIHDGQAGGDPPRRGGQKIAGEFGQTWERNFRRNGDRKRRRMVRMNPGADVGLDQQYPVFDDSSRQQSTPIAFRPIGGERGEVLNRNF